MQSARAQTLRVSGVKFNDFFPENAGVEGDYAAFPEPLSPVDCGVCFLNIAKELRHAAPVGSTWPLRLFPAADKTEAFQTGPGRKVPRK